MDKDFDVLVSPRVKEPEKEKERDILEHISRLPSELKLEILKHMCFDQLMMLNLPRNFLRSVLSTPANVDFETWLTEYLVRRDEGFIFIK